MLFKGKQYYKSSYQKSEFLKQKWPPSILRLRSVLASALAIGNESVPKIIIINNTIIFLTAISILAISNHNSFRVLFEKLLPYILFERKMFIF